jgi:hypothetical protein
VDTPGQPIFKDQEMLQIQCQQERLAEKDIFL